MESFEPNLHLIQKNEKLNNSVQTQCIMYINKTLIKMVPVDCNTLLETLCTSELWFPLRPPVVSKQPC